MKKLKKATLLALIFSVGLVAGCDFMPTWRVDRKLQQDLFFKCLDKLPAGPRKTKYNDWDEVIAECGNQSRSMANKCISGCN